MGFSDIQFGADWIRVQMEGLDQIFSPLLNFLFQLMVLQPTVNRTSSLLCFLSLSMEVLVSDCPLYLSSWKPQEILGQTRVKTSASPFPIPVLWALKKNLCQNFKNNCVQAN